MDEATSKNIVKGYAVFSFLWTMPLLYILSVFVQGIVKSNDLGLFSLLFMGLCVMSVIAVLVIHGIRLWRFQQPSSSMIHAVSGFFFFFGLASLLRYIAIPYGVIVGLLGVAYGGVGIFIYFNKDVKALFEKNIDSKSPEVKN